MGLRRRLLNRIKRTLSSEEEGAEPPAPTPPKVYAPPPGTMPPEEEPEPAPPPSEEPLPVEASPPLVVEPAVEPPTEPAPSALPQPGDLPIRIQNRDDGEEGWASDYATDDAPVRNAHYRPVFESSKRSLQVRILTEDEGLDVTFDCEPGEFVLDAADRAGQELPFSCRSGGCLACSAKMLSGSIEMGEQYVLEDEHIARDFVLLCCSSPLTDIVVVSHQEDNIQ